ncbi:MAG: rhomboid family intramembrane serine protease [Chitinophagaceae bacterium]|nr:rhomboid family intramembrane serine protease [Chitinophagaceae bacterium]
MTEFRPSRFEILPTVVKNLLIINGLFFLAQNTFGGHGSDFSFENVLALHAWQSSLFRPWQLITHMFLHGDLGHIFGNMLALWMFGSVLENLWGPKRFLTFFIICGLGAALMHLLFLSYEMIPLMKDYAAILQERAANTGQTTELFNFGVKHPNAFNQIPDLVNVLANNPTNADASNTLFQYVTGYYETNLNTATIGASGAVFGILAAFVYLFPNTYIYLYFLVPVKAKWLGIIYFSYELFFALRNSAGDNIARWAHIGGAIVGLLIVMTWNKKNKKTFY